MARGVSYHNSKDPNPPQGCTGCYWDDYAETWRHVAECPVHGERVRLAARHAAGDVIRNGRWTKAEKVEAHWTGDTPAPTYDPPPSHYEGENGIDPWAYIEAHGLDYWAGNVIKYVTRAGRKEIATIEDDLIKARNYLNYMIERHKGA